MMKAQLVDGVPIFDLCERHHILISQFDERQKEINKYDVIAELMEEYVKAKKRVQSFAVSVALIETNRNCPQTDCYGMAIKLDPGTVTPCLCIQERAAVTIKLAASC